MSQLVGPLFSPIHPTFFLPSSAAGIFQASKILREVHGKELDLYRTELGMKYDREMFRPLSEMEDVTFSSVFTDLRIKV